MKIENIIYKHKDTLITSAQGVIEYIKQNYLKTDRFNKLPWLKAPYCLILSTGSGGFVELLGFKENIITQTLGTQDLIINLVYNPQLDNSLIESRNVIGRGLPLTSYEIYCTIIWLDRVVDNYVFTLDQELMWGIQHKK